MNTPIHAGDLSPNETWDILEKEEAAVMIDVRTDAEFTFIGAPDLSTLGKPVHEVSWILFPNMERNPHFEDAVKEIAPDAETPVLFICRSGQRSAYAAAAMTALGYKRCYNVAEGFEGDKNDDLHRGTLNGWKVRGLPWVQT